MNEATRDDSGYLNPFKMVDGVPQLRDSFVSFVDILGYRSTMARMSDDPDALATYLSKLRSTLYDSTALMRYLACEDEKRDFQRRDAERQRTSKDSALDAPFFVMNFTDSVVLAYPDEGWNAESALNVPCDMLAVFQLSMAEIGVFVRGGVSRGQAYFDDCLQTGEAFLDAYRIESEVAVVPRIVLSDRCLDELKRDWGYYGYAKTAPQNIRYLVDRDGKVFINYLSELVCPAFADGCSDSYRERCLRSHRDSIESALADSGLTDRVRAKYRWLARYHDYFCEDFAGPDFASYRVGLDYGKCLVSPPKRLDEMACFKA